MAVSTSESKIKKPVSDNGFSPTQVLWSVNVNEHAFVGQDVIVMLFALLGRVGKKQGVCPKVFFPTRDITVTATIPDNAIIFKNLKWYIITNNNATVAMRKMLLVDFLSTCESVESLSVTKRIKVIMVSLNMWIEVKIIIGKRPAIRAPFVEYLSLRITFNEIE